jgi:hypothetical protein
MKPQVGDMIHIPSETYLVRQCEQLAEHKVLRLQQPRSLLVVGEDMNFYTVLLSGSPWRVEKRDTFAV